MEKLTSPSRLITIRAREQLTIPQDMREVLQLDREAALNVFRVGRVLLMTPKRLQRASLAAEVEREMKRIHLTFEDLLRDPMGQRERYIAETYSKD